MGNNPLEYEFGVIGYTYKDGYPALLTDKWFTLTFSSNPSSEDNTKMQKLIDHMKEECDKRGEIFPEFYWTGYRYVQKLPIERPKNIKSCNGCFYKDNEPYWDICNMCKNYSEYFKEE